jgi:hypothetical protein
MNKVKIAFWLIIVGFFSMVIIQNQSYFMSKNGLDINLYFTQYQVPQIPNLLFLAGFFLAGFLLAYFFNLYEKFRNGQTLKSLNQQLTARADTIARLETENDSLKSAMAEAHSKNIGKEAFVQEEKNMTEPDREPEA